MGKERFGWDIGEIVMDEEPEPRTPEPRELPPSRTPEPRKLPEPRTPEPSPGG